MMLRILMLLACCGSLLLSSAQTRPVMEVGDKKMNLQIANDAEVLDINAFMFAQDTMYTTTLPRNMWKIDTLVEMDLVTQEEKMAFATDSTLRVHINLGAQTRQQVSAAVAAKFSLDKNCPCLMEEADIITISGGKGQLIHIDYRSNARADLPQSATQKIEALPIGSTVIIKALSFHCEDKQDSMRQHSFKDMAVMKIKE